MTQICKCKVTYQKKMANCKYICSIWLFLQIQTTIVYLCLIQQNDCKDNLPKVEIANAAKFIALLCDDVHKWNDLVHQLVGAHRLYTWSGCYLISNKFVSKTIILFKFSDNLSIEQLCEVVGHLECLQIGLLQVYNQNNHIFNYYDYLSCIQILFLVTTCSSMV